jgi:hypothetical protein
MNLSLPKFLILFIVCSFSFLSINAQTQRTQTFTSNGSFTVPCGVTSISVQVWGGGGGGAGDGQNGNGAAGGGGGGGFSSGTITVTPGQIIAFTVGAGGVGGCGGGGGCPSGGGAGANGTSSTFLTITAGGGQGGQPANPSDANGGNGGVGGAGNIQGGNGSNGNSGTGNSGAGGNAANGGGGGGASSASEGNPGLPPGGGGSGAADNGGGTVTGGAGAPGRIIITFEIPSAGADQTLALCGTSTTMAAITPPVGTGSWQCAPSPCPAGVVIADVNNPNSALTVPANSTTSLVWVSSGAGCTASRDTVIITSPAGPGCATYCASVWTDLDDEYITRVQFSTMSNGSGTGPSVPDQGGYNNFTASVPCVNIVQGETYNLSVNWFVAGAFPETVVAFFDWNGDGNFDDEGEAVPVGTSSTAGNHSRNLSVTVPCGAAIGTVRLRVVIQFNGTPTGCNGGAFGETEDYCITVGPAPVPVSNAGSNQSITCTSTTLLSADPVALPFEGQWSLVSGSGTLTDPLNPNSSVTGLSNGNNVFEWNVASYCTTVSSQVTINVSGLPDVPVSAGDDLYTCLPSIGLNGSSPAPFNGQWVVLSGPSIPVFLPSQNDPNATISGYVNGVYQLQWQVNTASCGILTDNTTLTVGTLPVPNAGTDQTVCPTSTTLNAGNFTGVTGTWTVVSGPTGSGFIDVNDPDTRFYGLTAGTYTLEWTYTGGGCPGSTTDNVVITVNPCTTAIWHNPSVDMVHTGCNFIYTDDGGSTGNYTENVFMTRTVICPDHPDQYVTINFSQLNLGASNTDNLVIFTDDNPAAPIYRYADGANETSIPLNQTIVSDVQGACMIIQFTSSSLVNSTGTGWIATTGCTTVAPAPTTNPYILPSNCGGLGGIYLCEDQTVNPPTSFQGGQMDLTVGQSGNGNNGCMGSGESNEIWVYMTVVEAGTISFSIEGANGQDFDFAIWGPNPYVACPLNTRENPIRCSWAATGTGGNSECSTGDTGLGYFSDNGTPQFDVSEPSGPCSVPPGVNDGWVIPIDAQVGDIYVMLVNNYANNNAQFSFDYTGTAVLGCYPPPLLLSIYLSGISAFNAGNYNVIEWKTQMEKESDYFTVEKSINGYDWEIMQTVKASGNSTEEMSYSANDIAPYFPTTYYRVKQTNLSGENAYTNTVTVSVDKQVSGVISDLFPNPSSDRFSFIYGGIADGLPLRLELVNTIGQTVFVTQFESVQQNQLLTVDTFELQNGVYHVIVYQGDYRVVKKLVIQR